MAAGLLRLGDSLFPCAPRLSTLTRPVAPVNCVCAVTTSWVTLPIFTVRRVTFSAPLPSSGSAETVMRYVADMPFASVTLNPAPVSAVVMGVPVASSV
ncbi:MAG: hypothetical protein BWY76_00652 [bacterium ADurb.Bin429]|nr:MAG: hypothetical protein BWY76_00652 [bacterium ADurb.Bin429]